MKLARIALKDMGALKGLEIRDLSPGLNLLVGPTGSGKSTIRRALGGIFFGFDESSRRRMFPASRDSARGGLELMIGQHRYQLERWGDHWNAATDVLRHISSGTSNQSLSRNLGNLNATDYFTFFNFSLIDSPDLERRMVRSLSERLGVAIGRAPWSSESDYLRWRDDAQERRQRLDHLEAEHRHCVSRRDQLKRDWTHYGASGQERLSELESELDQNRIRRERTDSQFSILREQRDDCERNLADLRRLREGVATSVSSPLQPSEELARVYRRLDRVEKEIKRSRAVQRDLSRRRSELRDQRMQLSDHEARVRHSAALSARQNLGQLEQRIDQLSQILRDVAQYDHDHYPTPATDETRDRAFDDSAQQLEQAREDLYTLCQDLSRYHLQMSRGRLSAEGRDLRRCSLEMKRRLAWLKMRRQQILSDLQSLDPAGYELVRRGEKRFCDCARHAGHLEARRQFLEPTSRSIPAATTDHNLVETQWQEQLQLRDELDRSWQRLETDRDHLRNEHQRLLTERQELLDRRDDQRLRRELDDAQARLERLERELPTLRRRVTEDHPLWHLSYDSLLDRASQFVRQLTTGDLHRIWIDGDADRLAVTDANASDRTFENLGRSDQDLVCLSLSLAVAERWNSNGHPVPLIYDDLFTNLDDHRTQATCEVLQQCVADGQQVILLANGRQIDDRILADRFRHNHLPQPAIYYMPDLRDPSSVSWPVILVPGGKPHTLALPQPVVKTPVVATKIPMVINEMTLLIDLDLIERDALSILSDNRILTVSDLLDLDPTDLPVALTSRGITGPRVDRWQSQAWLLCCVPGLRPYDARLLVGSGISEPEMLEDLHAHDVLERLEHYLATNEGQRVMRSGTDYELARVNSWMRSLRENRSTWRGSDQRSGNSRYLRRRTQRGAVRLHQEDDPRSQWVFHLDLNDDLERAPSIGPKMAERFARLGIQTVEQFLASDPEELAELLDHRRVNARTLISWQHQARLVCRIPNLRGHDAQLLVACDIVDPETLLATNVEDLFSIVIPFSETDEGKKILRSSKAPDRDEILDWITWARRHRPLQVA